MLENVLYPYITNMTTIHHIFYVNSSFRTSCDDSCCLTIWITYQEFPKTWGTCFERLSWQPIADGPFQRSAANLQKKNDSSFPALQHCGISMMTADVMIIVGQERWWLCLWPIQKETIPLPSKKLFFKAWITPVRWAVLIDGRTQTRKNFRPVLGFVENNDLILLIKRPLCIQPGAHLDFPDRNNRSFNILAKVIFPDYRGPIIATAGDLSNRFETRL